MTSKCPKCGKTVYFAERTPFDGKDWHSLCLIAFQKEQGGIHNKGYYGTTPQDPAVVFKKAAPPSPGVNFCPSCGNKVAAPDAKFCASCGTKLK